MTTFTRYYFKKIFIFLGSKITTDGDCSHEIKRCLLLGRKVMTNLDSIFKSRDYSANKGPSSQGYGFSHGHVWMWELDCEESWALKNWCFWMWYWRRLLRVPWTASRSNQSILKEISPEYLFEGLMLKLKLKYFGHLMWWANSLEKTLMLGKIKGRRRRRVTGDEMVWASPIRRTWTWANSGRQWRTGKPGMLQSLGLPRAEHNSVTEQQQQQNSKVAQFRTSVEYHILLWKLCFERK